MGSFHAFIMHFYALMDWLARHFQFFTGKTTRNITGWRAKSALVHSLHLFITSVVESPVFFFSHYKHIGIKIQYKKKKEKYSLFIMALSQSHYRIVISNSSMCSSLLLMKVGVILMTLCAAEYINL